MVCMKTTGIRAKRDEKEKKKKAFHLGIQKYCNDYAAKKAYKDFKQVYKTIHRMRQYFLEK